MSGNVLVIGGAGFVGSHACKELKKAGYTPVTVDSMVCGHEWAVRWGPLVRLDVRDADGLEQVFREFKPLAVMHFAAFIAVGESVADPGKYYHNNLCGTLSVLETARKTGCERFIFSSTAAVYGPPSEVPIPETHPLNPVNPYAVSKRVIETVLEDYDSAYGFKSAVLRYFNAAGADPDGETGEAHDPETHLIPLAIRAALGTAPQLNVLGDDYPTQDGTCIRDYVHVTDLARAHVLALEHLLAKDESLCLNLGTGVGHSVLEVIGMVERVGGRKIPRVITPRRPGDVAELVAASVRARDVLGWTPDMPDLEAIVRTAWKWHLARG